MKFSGLLSVALITLLWGCSPNVDKDNKAETPTSGQPDSSVEFQAIIEAASDDKGSWLSHGRTYDEQRFSPLTQVNSSNVSELGLAWSYDLDTQRGQEATPLMVDGIMYTTSAWSKVQAFDVKTGKLLWQFDPEVPGKTAARGCCDVVNRGVAYWDGKVYVGSLDGRIRRTRIRHSLRRLQWGTGMALLYCSRRPQSSSRK